MILDADTVGHALLDQRPARDEAVARFGTEILDEEVTDRPCVDRRALGAIVFNDRHAMRDLERILHPRMRRTFAGAIDRAERKGQAKVIVLDAAILFEAGWNDLCDRVAFIDAPREQRLDRLASQRGWTEEVLARREANQIALDAKRGRADMILSNDAGTDHLAAQVSAVWEQLVPHEKIPSKPAPAPE
jgi:dephospho-CoA kinase